MNRILELRSESHTYTITGVAPPEFNGIYAPLRIDLWVPFRFWAGPDAARRRVMLFGVLKPGIAASQAAAELNTIAVELRTHSADLTRTAAAPITLEAVRGVPNPSSRRQAIPVVVLLMTVVALVLLIACVNDERDIAEVAVRVLTEDGHAGKEYVLTGPESLSQSEQIATIGRVIGRELAIEEVTPEEARAGCMAAFPAPAVSKLLDAWRAALGQPAFVTSTIRELTGREARMFEEWVRANAAVFNRALN